MNKEKQEYAEKYLLTHLKQAEQGNRIQQLEQPCAIEEFFKQEHPLGPPPCAMYCPCPKHRPTC